MLLNKKNVCKIVKVWDTLRKDEKYFTVNEKVSMGLLLEDFRLAFNISDDDLEKVDYISALCELEKLENSKE